MKMSTRTKILLFALLALINIILRIQAAPYEIGYDSFFIHIIANSISEFGYAKWLLHPLSVFGLYPFSYSSSVPFILSGISQISGLEMHSIVFIFGMILGILSMMTAYIMAGEIRDCDFFRFFVVFGFSTSPAILAYSTWTIPTRGMFVVLAPIYIYLLLKSLKYFKFASLIIIFSMFLLATHHMFYFLIPIVFGFLILVLYDKFKISTHPLLSKINIMGIIKERLHYILPIAGFVVMFSIPFFTRRFLEVSRFSPIYISYIRYLGILIIPALGGLFYLIFKFKRSLGEQLLLLSTIFLTALIYQVTYMKFFIAILIMGFVGFGLVNVIMLSKKYKYAIFSTIILLVLAIIFSGYYQFFKYDSEEGNPYNERHIEVSSFIAGKWIKNNMKNSAISHDPLFGTRILAISDTTHFLDTSSNIDQVYGFIEPNLTEFKKIPLTNERAWFARGFEGPDPGESLWFEVNLLNKNPMQLNITYVVENTRTLGNIVWKHGIRASNLLQYVYGEKNSIYHNGNVKIWKLD